MIEQKDLYAINHWIDANAEEEKLRDQFLAARMAYENASKRTAEAERPLAALVEGCNEERYIAFAPGKVLRIVGTPSGIHANVIEPEGVSGIPLWLGPPVETTPTITMVEPDPRD